MLTNMLYHACVPLYVHPSMPLCAPGSGQVAPAHAGHQGSQHAGARGRSAGNPADVVPPSTGLQLAVRQIIYSPP
jgi:hypothetical protein